MQCLSMPCWMWMSSCRFQGEGYLHGGFVNPSNMLLLLHSLPLNPAFSMGLDHYNCLWCLRKLSWNNWNVFHRFRIDLSCYPPRLFRDISYYCSSQPVWHCGWGCVLPQPQKYPVYLQKATVICISPAENWVLNHV